MNKSIPLLLGVVPLLVLNAIFAVTGCQNVALRDPVDLAVVGITTGVLRNNPGYQPMVGDVIHRIDVLVSRGYSSPELVTEFLTELQSKYNLSVGDIANIHSTLLQIRAIYRGLTGQDFPLQVPVGSEAEKYMRRVQAALAEGTIWAQAFPKKVS